MDIFTNGFLGRTSSGSTPVAATGYPQGRQGTGSSLRLLTIPSPPRYTLVAADSGGAHQVPHHGDVHLLGAARGCQQWAGGTWAGTQRISSGVLEPCWGHVPLPLLCVHEGCPHPEPMSMSHLSTCQKDVPIHPISMLEGYPHLMSPSNGSPCQKDVPIHHLFILEMSPSISFAMPRCSHLPPLCAKECSHLSPCCFGRMSHCRI